MDNRTEGVIMLQRLIHALISTAIIILAVPLVGLLIDFINEEIGEALARAMGVSTAWFIMNILTFPGTIHHELSHALYALLTGAKVKKVVIFHPEKDRLGYVEFEPRGIWLTKAIQLTLAGIAPTVQGFITDFALVWLLLTFSPLPIWVYIVAGYVILSIFIHMTMSPADIKSAVKGLPIVTLLVLIICFAFGIDLFGIVKNIPVIQEMFSNVVIMS